MEQNMNNRILNCELPYIKETKKCSLYRMFDQVPARLVLYLLSWSGFMVSFMMRNDIHLAMVAMVADPPLPSNSSDEYCFVVANNNSTPVDYGGTLKWSAAVQSYVIAAFYWGYSITQIIGSLLTQKLGTKQVFGYSQLATALCSFYIPMAAETHFIYVIALRFIQGFASGLTWPSMYALIGHWIPFPERSTFISSFQGFNIGIGLIYLISGFLIAHLSWKSVFYTNGCLGALWCIFWYFLVFDSPETHPRISFKEQEFIRNTTVTTYKNSKEHRVPWRSIITSKPVWAIGITAFGRIWINFTLVSLGPSYMKRILGFTIEKNGFLSGVPFIFCYFASLFFGFIADKVITKNYMGLTNLRKLMTSLSQMIPAVLVPLATYLGCDVELILLVWFIAIIMGSAGFAGCMTSIVDIAPSYSGSIAGILQTFYMTSSFICPMVNFRILEGREYQMSTWRIVFYVASFVSFGTSVVFLVWGTGDVQPWNFPLEKADEGEAEELTTNSGKDVELKNKAQNII